MALFDFFKDYSQEANEIKNYLINTWGMRSEYATPFVEVYKNDLGKLVSRGRKKMSELNLASSQGEEYLKMFSDNDLRFSLVGQSYHAYFKDLRNGRHIGSPIEYAVWAILFFENDLVAAQNHAFANFIIKNVDSKVPGIERVLNENESKDSELIIDRAVNKIRTDYTDKECEQAGKNKPLEDGRENSNYKKPADSKKNNGESLLEKIYRERDEASFKTVKVSEKSKVIIDIDFYEAIFSIKGFLGFILSKPSGFYKEKLELPVKNYCSDVSLRLNSCKQYALSESEIVTKSECEWVISPMYILIIAISCHRLGIPSIGATKLALDFFAQRTKTIECEDSKLYRHFEMDRLIAAATLMVNVLPSISYNKPSEKLFLESTAETIVNLAASFKV
jgi:hypothetical protein